MKGRVLWLVIPIMLVPIVLPAAVFLEQSKGEKMEEKRVVMIIASKNFRDEELQKMFNL